MTGNRRFSVTVCLGENTAAAVQLASAHVAVRSKGRVVLATPDWVSEADRAAARSVLPAEVTEVVAAARANSALWQALRPRFPWTAVDVGDRAPRLRTAWLPRPIAEADSVLLLNTLAGQPAARPPIALALPALFAHPRQRAGATLGDPVENLTVELARAFGQPTVLLLDRWRSCAVAIVADSLVVAELFGLAWWRATSGENVERSGVWEDRLVQRATELLPAPRTGDDITLRSLAQTSMADREAAELRSLIAGIADELSVTDDASDLVR